MVLQFTSGILKPQNGDLKVCDCILLLNQIPEHMWNNYHSIKSLAFLNFGRLLSAFRSDCYMITGESSEFVKWAKCLIDHTEMEKVLEIFLVNSRMWSSQSLAVADLRVSNCYELSAMPWQNFLGELRCSRYPPSWMWLFRILSPARPIGSDF